MDGLYHLVIVIVSTGAYSWLLTSLSNVVKTLHQEAYIIKVYGMQQNTWQVMQDYTSISPVSSCFRNEAAASQQSIGQRT